MIEILCGISLASIAAFCVAFNSWQKEREKRSEAEEKVRAHEELQAIDADIATGGDEYISEQLRKHTRDL